MLTEVKKPEYPDRETHKIGGWTYASDMIHLAVNRDDAEAFMRFLAECGGPNVEVFVSGNIFNYAAEHGAVECLKALFAAHGEHAKQPIEHYMRTAAKPPYGPRRSDMR